MIRLIVGTDPQTVEINYTWLPTWLGLNEQLISKLADRIRPLAVGRVIDDDTLTVLENRLILLLVQEFPYIEGLDVLLRAVHNITITEKSRSTTYA